MIEKTNPSIAQKNVNIATKTMLKPSQKPISAWCMVAMMNEPASPIPIEQASKTMKVIALYCATLFG